MIKNFKEILLNEVAERKRLEQIAGCKMDRNNPVFDRDISHLIKFLPNQPSFWFNR
jgi:hypothetical protein